MLGRYLEQLAVCLRLELTTQLRYAFGGFIEHLDRAYGAIARFACSRTRFPYGEP
jgi:hypothetical protein